MNFLKGWLFTSLVIIAIGLAMTPRIPDFFPALWSTHTVLNPTTITYVTMTVATKCAWLSRTLSHVYLETTTVELRDPANLDLANIALFIVILFLAALLGNRARRGFNCPFRKIYTHIGGGEATKTYAMCTLGEKKRREPP